MAVEMSKNFTNSTMNHPTEEGTNVSLFRESFKHLKQAIIYNFKYGIKCA